MEALRSLISGDLPPVGNPITLKSRGPAPEIPGYLPTWVDSGTAALALALLDAKTKKPEILQPEVIIPAYCCPDLVAAALYAGVRPVIADISAGDIAFEINTLEKTITDNTLAIVAMTFLGIREDWTLLNGLRMKYPNLLIIEDNAQWFPDLNGTENFCADYLVFSFGRGNPLSLLGGGALFSLEPLDVSANESTGSSSHYLQTFKYLAYNQLLQPNLYWFLNHNPFITLGQTRFHALHSIQPMDSYRQNLLGINFSHYRHRSRELERIYQEELPENTFRPHPALDSLRHHRLLRYPIFCADKNQRDLLLHKLNTLGLGATALYRLPLAEIEGLENKIACRQPYPHASDFAHRLITLPIHSGVRYSHIKKIVDVLKKFS